jgi:hypothetical protein
MTDPIDNDELEQRKKKETEGKGRAGGSGSGAIGTDVRGIAFAVDAAQKKEIWANWRQMDLGETVTALLEFVSEGVMRASANLSVDWAKAANLKDAGYAVNNKLIAFCQDMLRATRERTREATAYVQRKYGVSFKFKRGGQTIIASQNPQAG